MKLTGLPSPFRLIMMLRPALRTSHRFFCSAGVDHLDHAAGRAEIAHHLARAGASFPCKRRELLAAELDQQDRRGTSDQGALDERPVARIIEAEIDHDAVDQLDGARLEPHEVLRGEHRVAK